MNQPLVSIIMPVYNAGEFLEECLNSVLSQSYPHWELIAVNDQSTDQSGQILTDYEAQHAQVHVLHTTEKGIIPALQLGYQHIKGDLVTRMDADDRMDPEKLELMVNTLMAHGAGHVCIGMVEYFASNKDLGEGYLKYAQWLNQLADEYRWDEIYKECVIPSPNWMMYRTDLEGIGGLASHNYPEDYDLCFRMYTRGLKICSVPQVTHYWRDHDHRTSRTSPHYTDNRFLTMKCDYFTSSENTENLYLWGAGKKGKIIANQLRDRQVAFTWITQNKKKAGHVISGQRVQQVEQLDFLQGGRVIVATTQDRDQILDFCRVKQLTPYIFC